MTKPKQKKVKAWAVINKAGKIIDVCTDGWTITYGVFKLKCVGGKLEAEGVIGINRE